MWFIIIPYICRAFYSLQSALHTLSHLSLITALERTKHRFCDSLFTVEERRVQRMMVSRCLAGNWLRRDFPRLYRGTQRRDAFLCSSSASCTVSLCANINSCQRSSPERFEAGREACRLEGSKGRGEKVLGACTGCGRWFALEGSQSCCFIFSMYCRDQQESL